MKLENEISIKNNLELELKDLCLEYIKYEKELEKEGNTLTTI